MHKKNQLSSLLNYTVSLVQTLGFILVSTLALLSCSQQKKPDSFPQETTAVSLPKIKKDKPDSLEALQGMVWIPGGYFKQGAVANDQMAMNHEKPSFEVAVDGFFIDVTEVTNKQFAEFVDATGYKTVAERPIDWEEMKAQVPQGTPKPADSILAPGSLVFNSTTVSNMQDLSQWWKWTIRANWKHPSGPKSTIEGKEDHPVIHIAYEDAIAYCEWKGTRLPTEAEWEYAARGGNEKAIFTWGNDLQLLKKSTNSWTGTFPSLNDGCDGFIARAAVKSFAPNPYGLYDMAGNVWEWTSDWYNINYYKENSARQKYSVNPSGATEAFNPNSALASEKVIKGGSFLCNASYCASYRISARMASTLDSSAEHLGFRTVKN